MEGAQPGDERLGLTVPAAVAVHYSLLLCTFARVPAGAFVFKLI